MRNAAPTSTPKFPCRNGRMALSLPISACRAPAPSDNQGLLFPRRLHGGSYIHERRPWLSIGRQTDDVSDERRDAGHEPGRGRRWKSFASRKRRPRGHRWLTRVPRRRTPMSALADPHQSRKGCGADGRARHAAARLTSTSKRALLPECQGAFRLGSGELPMTVAKVSDAISSHRSHCLVRSGARLPVSRLPV